MEREVFMAEVFVPPARTVKQLGEFMAEMNARNSAASATYFPVKRMVRIVLDGYDSSLSAAPDGTHEFARGWLAHEAAMKVARFAGRSVQWEPVRLYDHGRISRSARGRRPISVGV